MNKKHTFKVGDIVRFIDTNKFPQFYGQEREVVDVMGDKIHVMNERGVIVHF